MLRSSLLAGLLTASTAQAQTSHPCDATLPTNPNAGPTSKIRFCAPVNQTPLLQVKAYRIYLDGKPAFEGPLTPIGAPNAAGLGYFESPALTWGPGAHVVTVSAIHDLAGEGDKAPDYPFTAVPRPAAPTKVGIVAAR